MVQLQAWELGVKERSLQLQEDMICATDHQKSNDKQSTQVESLFATKFDSAIHLVHPSRTNSLDGSSNLNREFLLRPTISKMLRKELSLHVCIIVIIVTS
jgi:hypothetical protein